MARPIVTSSPDILSGTPVFAGTRVPVQALIDYLEGGGTIDDFLAGFPTVRREQVVAFLEEATARMTVKALARVLLDECVDQRLAGDIRGHDVVTVPSAGWAALTNGELLTRAQREFDAFVTVDRNLPFQQELSRFSISVIVLRARSNRVGDLRALIPQLSPPCQAQSAVRSRGSAPSKALERTRFAYRSPPALGDYRTTSEPLRQRYSVQSFAPTPIRIQEVHFLPSGSTTALYT